MAIGFGGVAVDELVSLFLFLLIFFFERGTLYSTE